MEVLIIRINSRVDAAKLLDRPSTPAKSQILNENFQLEKRGLLKINQTKSNFFSIPSRTKLQLHTLLHLLSDRNKNSNLNINIVRLKTTNSYHPKKVKIIQMANNMKI